MHIKTNFVHTISFVHPNELSCTLKCTSLHLKDHWSSILSYCSWTNSLLNNFIVSIHMLNSQRGILYCLWRFFCSMLVTWNIFLIFIYLSLCLFLSFVFLKIWGINQLKTISFKLLSCKYILILNHIFYYLYLI